MNCVARTWRDLRGRGKKAPVPYITPEYPFKGMTVPLLQRLAEAGADLIEVGVPFSDPLADGKTIQLDILGHSQSADAAERFFRTLRDEE